MVYNCKFRINISPHSHKMHKNITAATNHTKAVKSKGEQNLDYNVHKMASCEHEIRRMLRTIVRGVGLDT